MDIKKLYEKVIHSEEVHDIPLVHILAVYPEIPTDMMDKWEKAHKEYVEKAA